VKKAIAACRHIPNPVLTFPPGRYDFWTSKAEKREYFVSNTTTEQECSSKIKNIAILFEGMSNLTLEGNGSLFVFHGKTITFALDSCRNIRIANLSVDFERPSMTELTIEKLSPTRMIASIHPDSHYTIMDGRIRFYGEGWGMNDHFFCIQTDTVQGTNQYSSWDAVKDAKATELEPFKVMFENDFSPTNYVAGRTLTIRSHIRDHVGVFVNRSSNITLEDVNLHYMHGLGVVSQFSENLTYRHVHITPSRGRTIAAFADGMHFSGCKGFIELKECLFRGLHDDPVNVHGTYLRIMKTENIHTHIVRYMHGQTYGFQPYYEGDTLAFVSHKTLLTEGRATVVKVSRLSEREYRVELDEPLPANITEGDCLENITWTPSLHIDGCIMEMTNTRGLLVTTPRKVVVENNYFYRTGMYAIQIAADANSWFESGAVTDVIIRNNVFDGCGYNLGNGNQRCVIAIEPEVQEEVENRYVHRNIRIVNNVFHISSGNRLVKSRSTDALSVKDNEVKYFDKI
jgi:hypothetical protein